MDVLLFGIGSLIAGIIGYYFSLRGWSMGSHPSCRACGFNLYNLPLDRRHCPECGADILADGAVAIGQRKTIKTGVIISLAVVLLGAVVIGKSGMKWWTGYDGSPFKATAWLVRDVDAADMSSRERACRELQRRVLAGGLSAPETDGLATKILRLGNEALLPWDSRWGDLLQAARHAQKLSPAAWEKYLAQAMHVSVRVRPRIGADDPMPLVVVCKLKAGRDHREIVPARLLPEIFVMENGREIALDASAQPLDIVPMPVAWSAIWMRKAAAQNSAGEAASATAVIRVAMTLQGGNGTRATHVETFSLPYEILPAGQSSVTLRTNVTPEIARAFSTALHWKLNTRPNGDVALPATGEKIDLGNLWIAGAPVAAAFRVVLRQHNREWTVARFVCANDSANVPLTCTAGRADGPQAGAAQIVCVPEPGLAAGTVDIMEVWGAEVTESVELESARAP